MSAKKSRFDGLDVAAMTSHLKRSMLGFKLANVYDGNALGVSGTASSAGGSSDGAKGVYMFKLADASGGAAANSGGDGKKKGGSKDGENGENGDDATKSVEDEEEVTQQANGAQDSKRAMLLIESGVRFHPTT